MTESIETFEGQHSFLSNFYPVTIEYQGKTYPSSEHAYQAAKTLDDDERESIAILPTAAAAKKAGKHVQLRDNWSTIKDQIMFDICWIKFNVPHLREKLLATKDAMLVEGNWWHDTYWGVCNGKGRNQLGKTLMQIRNLLKTDILY